jgi:hypothetical protein
MIFDCCFNFLATREIQPDGRIVEIIAAGEERDPIAFRAGTRTSFTSKLHVEVRTLQQQQKRSVEVADIITTLRATSPGKKPSHCAKLGFGSIVLPLIVSHQTPNPSKGGPSRQANTLMATFSLHVSDNYSRDQLLQLAEWIRGLDQDAKLKLESVKETCSMLFILEGTYLAFSRISGLPGVELIDKGIFRGS